jgi:hypothetical protein
MILSSQHYFVQDHIPGIFGKGKMLRRSDAAA